MELTLVDPNQSALTAGVAIPAVGLPILVTGALVGVATAGIAYMGSKPSTRARNARWTGIVAGSLTGLLMLLGGAKALSSATE